MNRDEAIADITNNKVMAGLLSKEDVAEYMSLLHQDCDDRELAVLLKHSASMYQMSLRRGKN